MSDAHDSGAGGADLNGGTARVVPFPTREVAAEIDPLELAERETIEALKDALEDLRLEIRGRLSQVDEGPDSGSEFLKLFEQLRRRASSIGVSERSAVVDDFGMDLDALSRLRPLIDLLVDRYWRVDVRGLENLPASGPCLFVANHSGLLPYDGLVLSHVLEREGLDRPRFLVADWLITLPFAQPALARWGGVRACRENADRLLRTGRSVVAFPEGAKGAAKVFRDRYRLQRFGRGGAVRAALQNQVPLVPVGIVGAEEAHPILFKSKLPARLLGLPFLPVTPTFPWMGPLGLLPLPSKWVISFGAPVDLESSTGAGEGDPLGVSRMTESLRERVEVLVEEGLAARESVWA